MTDTVYYKNTCYTQDWKNCILFPILNRTALQYAVKWNHLKVVKELIDQGANVNTATAVNHLTPLHIALEIARAYPEQYQDVALYLIDHGSDVNAKKRYTYKGNDECTSERPLHLAAFANQVEVMRHLVEKGADISAVDCYNQTALHHAGAGVSSDAFNWLADYSIEDLTRLDIDNQTPCDSFYREPKPQNCSTILGDRFQINAH